MGIHKYYQKEQTKRRYSKYMKNYETIIKINNNTEAEVQKHGFCYFPLKSTFASSCLGISRTMPHS